MTPDIAMSSIEADARDSTAAATWRANGDATGL